jgi:hypothetical protein
MTLAGTILAGRIGLDANNRQLHELTSGADHNTLIR